MSNDETRRWPDGKLCPHDNGSIGMAIGRDNGRIIIQFPSAIKWIGMPPDQAREFARILIVNAIEAEREGYGDETT
jgi:hypothetical protein